MQDVFVVSACHTPIGKMGGALKSLTVADLSVIVFAEVLKQLGIDQSKLNVNGGAIALGHPARMTGARLITALCYELQRRPDAKYGLATLCVGGGFGSATVIEKV